MSWHERVPVSLIAPLIVRWREENADITGEAKNEGTLGSLARESGVSSRQLRRIINNKVPGTRGEFVDYISFNSADKIVCATVGPYAWHQEPLKQFYGPLKVMPAERKYEHPVPEELAADRAEQLNAAFLAEQAAA